MLTKFCDQTESRLTACFVQTVNATGKEVSRRVNIDVTIQMLSEGRSTCSVCNETKIAERIVSERMKKC